MLGSFILPPWVTITWQVIKRAWPLILIVGAGLWISSVVIDRNSLRYEEQARRTQAKAVQLVLKRAVDWRVISAENRRIAEQCCTDATKWQAAFDAEHRRPPRVEVQIVDRIDGSTAQTMAVSGSRISRELVGELRDRLGGGGP